MPSQIVQFRVPDEDFLWLREQGENPNVFARAAFERWLRRRRAEVSFERLRGSGFRLWKPAADIIREERESH